MALYSRPRATDQVTDLSISTIADARKHTGATTEEAIARPAEASAKLDRGLAQIEEMAVNMANVQMATEANVQDLTRATLKTATMKDDSQVVMRSQTAGKNYHEDGKGKHPEEHQQGPPSIHIGSAMSSALSDEPNVSPEMKVGMKEIVDFHKTQAGAAHVIKHCRITKCWKPGMVKIIYRFLEREEIVATRALAMAGGTLKHGQPPQGTLSRRIAAN